MPGVFCILLVVPSLVLSITLGTITDRPSRYYPKYRLLADYIQRKLSEAGLREEVGVRFARDVDQMITLMKRGEVDVFVDSVYPTLKVCRATGCEPILIRWKNGVRTYKSVVFVRKDSPVRSVKDLAGSRIAFDSPYSTSGYLIPKKLLKGMGLKLIELKDPSHKVPRDSVGYLFAGGEENVVAWGLVYSHPWTRILKASACSQPSTVPPGLKGSAGRILVS
ncbi:MAG: PhnD/SsuA/transferrin family substrate-binding protein [Aquificota bacterium]|nr:PhnD/SsuA/transferrin family substrate-binding protein [Aquificota bacterium]